MDIGVTLTAPADTANFVDTVVAHARDIAAAGLRSVWLGQRFDYDSPGVAAIVGREVPDLRVGTSAIPIFGRHPLLVAGQAQTAQAATHGHYQLGLGLGAPALVENALGIPYQRPIALLREFLTVLNTVLATGTVDHRGELLTAVTRMPVTLAGARPTVPVLVAAMGPQALRVTGELADGTLPYLAGPRTLAERIVPAITSAAQRAGRPAPRIVAFVAGVVTDDVAAARERAVRQMAFYDNVPSYQRVVGWEGATRAAELAVIGDEDAIATAVRRYVDAGATEVVFTQTDLAGPAGQRRTWQVLGELSR